MSTLSEIFGVASSAITSIFNTSLSGIAFMWNNIVMSSGVSEERQMTIHISASAFSWILLVVGILFWIWWFWKEERKP